jgi:hypothetical protein
MANQKGIAFRKESDSRLHRCERLEASGRLCDGIERLTGVGDFTTIFPIPCEVKVMW